MNSTNLIGQILIEQFRVDAFVASGGMGAVYKVWDLRRNVPLAMKILHSDLAEDPSIFKRFQREARALQKLAHPNIVPFYGLYRDDDITFLLERYVDGPSLRDVLRQHKGSALPVSEVLCYLKALCAALGYAHSSGVIHCDVKPGNVMLDQGGNIYLTDFGIARHSDSSSTTLGAAGSPAYMAPEQIRGEPVTPATDVYALGIMLFEMLTGRRPFRGDESGSISSESRQGGTTQSERIRMAQLTQEPPDILLLNPSVPAALVKVVQRCLAKDPAKRYQSAHDLLEAACQAAGIATTSIPDRVALNQTQIPHAMPTVSAATQQRRQVSGNSPVKRSNVGKLVAGGIVVVALLCIGVASLTKTLAGNQSGREISLMNSNTSASIATESIEPTEAPYAYPTPEPSPTPEPTRAPGDTRTNPADGAVEVYIPAGEFLYGKNLGTKNTDAFWIYQTEVTNGMYAQCVYAGVCPRPKSVQSYTQKHYFDNSAFDNYPVIFISAEDATAYCKWAGDRRLPNEVEWEKAARGLNGYLYPWGDTEPNCQQANYGGGGCEGDTQSVGEASVGDSPFGVKDMAGNVWEFATCVTTSCTKYQTVIRGGSWQTKFYEARTWVSYNVHPQKKEKDQGFRCAVSD